MPGGLAARVAGWQKRLGAWPGISTPASSPAAPPFPQSPLDVVVQIYVDGSWIDITPSVYGGGRAQIEVTRGRANEAGQVDPSRARFQLNNRDGQFSPRNPTSWLYGKIGRNTQVRIAIGADVRFSGEISEWPQRWDTSGTDIYVPVEASGILRRLGQGATPLKSTMYRGYTSIGNFLPSQDAAPVAYWPCEDAEGSTVLGSGLGGPPMTVSGTPTLASNTDFKCSSPLPLLTSSEWTGTVPAYPDTGFVGVWMLVSFPSVGGTNGQAIFRLFTTGSVVRWDLVYITGGTLALKGYDADGTEVANQTVLGFGLNANPQRVILQLQTTGGSNLDWELKGQHLDGTIVGSSGTFAGLTVSRALRVVVNPGQGLGDVAFGHVAVHKATRLPSDLIDEFIAHVGETAGRRVERLCDEESITFRAVGDLDATSPMGAQLPKTLVELLREAADADQGILYEPRDVFGLAYRTRDSLCRQDARLQLDYAAAHLSGIDPVDDDQQVRNDITVKRLEGSSARAVSETGPLSVQAPPDGIGRYDEEVTQNLRLDSQLGDAAGWLLHLGTVDEARYPVLQVDLARAPFVADQTLALACQALDVGDRLTVANPPAWLPPDQISQLAQGMAETMGNFTHRIDVNCSPETPWGQAARYDDGTSRYSSDGSTLGSGITSSATSLSVATPSGPLWSHADGDFNIRIGGEVMTVTAVAGASSPQTFTVTRSVNSVVKAQPSGAAVELAQPKVYAI
jgi:hypothetical protein